MKTSKKLVVWMNDLVSGILAATAIGEYLTADVEALEQEVDTLRARIQRLEQQQGKEDGHEDAED